MARTLAIQHIRTTRANLNTQAAAENLKAGELYLITDEDRIAIGLTTSTYETYAKESEAGGGGGGLTVGREITDATDDFETTDVDTMILANRATAQTFTIPHTTFAESDIITVMQIGAGITTIAVADGAKQTINSANKTWGADSVIQIICLDDTANAEIWKVIGGVL
jgi:hypothetical protein